jgi:hypothetical protein
LNSAVTSRAANPLESGCRLPTVTATSDIPDANKGLASGLITTSQRIAVTVGVPILGAVMAIRSDLLAGIHLALVADVLLTLTAVVLIRTGLNSARFSRVTGGY